MRKRLIKLYSNLAKHDLFEAENALHDIIKLSQEQEEGEEAPLTVEQQPVDLSVIPGETTLEQARSYLQYDDGAYSFFAWKLDEQHPELVHAALNKLYPKPGAGQVFFALGLDEKYPQSIKAFIQLLSFDDYLNMGLVKKYPEMHELFSKKVENLKADVLARTGMYKHYLDIYLEKLQEEFESRNLGTWSFDGVELDFVSANKEKFRPIFNKLFEGAKDELGTSYSLDMILRTGLYKVFTEHNTDLIRMLSPRRYLYHKMWEYDSDAETTLKRVTTEAPQVAFENRDLFNHDEVQKLALEGLIKESDSEYDHYDDNKFRAANDLIETLENKFGYDFSAKEQRFQEYVTKHKELMDNLFKRFFIPDRGGLQVEKITEAFEHDLEVYDNTGEINKVLDKIIEDSIGHGITGYNRDLLAHEKVRTLYKEEYEYFLNNLIDMHPIDFLNYFSKAHPELEKRALERLLVQEKTSANLFFSGEYHKKYPELTEKFAELAKNTHPTVFFDFKLDTQFSDMTATAMENLIKRSPRHLLESEEIRARHPEQIKNAALSIASHTSLGSSFNYFMKSKHIPDEIRMEIIESGQADSAAMSYNPFFEDQFYLVMPEIGRTRLRNLVENINYEARYKDTKSAALVAKIFFGIKPSYNYGGREMTKENAATVRSTYPEFVGDALRVLANLDRELFWRTREHWLGHVDTVSEIFDSLVETIPGNIHRELSYNSHYLKDTPFAIYQEKAAEHYLQKNPEEFAKNLYGQYPEKVEEAGFKLLEKNPKIMLDMILSRFLYKTRFNDHSHEGFAREFLGDNKRPDLFIKSLNSIPELDGFAWKDTFSGIIKYVNTALAPEQVSLVEDSLKKIIEKAAYDAPGYIIDQYDKQIREGLLPMIEPTDIERAAEKFATLEPISFIPYVMSAHPNARNPVERDERVQQFLFEKYFPRAASSLAEEKPFDLFNYVEIYSAQDLVSKDTIEVAMQNAMSGLDTIRTYLYKQVYLVYPEYTERLIDSLFSLDDDDTKKYAIDNLLNAVNERIKSSYDHPSEDAIPIIFEQHKDKIMSYLSDPKNLKSLSTTTFFDKKFFKVFPEHIDYFVSELKTHEIRSLTNNSEEIVKYYDGNEAELFKPIVTSLLYNKKVKDAYKINKDSFQLAVSDYMEGRESWKGYEPDKSALGIVAAIIKYGDQEVASLPIIKNFVENLFASRRIKAVNNGPGLNRQVIEILDTPSPVHQGRGFIFSTLDVMMDRFPELIRRNMELFALEANFEILRNIKDRDMAQVFFEKLKNESINDENVEAPPYIKISRSIFQYEQRPESFSYDADGTNIRYTISQNNTQPTSAVYDIGKKLIHAGDGVVHTNVGASGFTSAWALASMQDGNLVIEQYQSDYPVFLFSVFNVENNNPYTTQTQDGRTITVDPYQGMADAYGKDPDELREKFTEVNNVLKQKYPKEYKDTRRHFDYISKVYPFLVIKNCIEVAQSLGLDSVYILKEAPRYADIKNKEKAKRLYVEIPSLAATGTVIINEEDVWKIPATDKSIQIYDQAAKKSLGRDDDYDFSLTPYQNAVKSREMRQQQKQLDWKPNPEKIRKLKDITEQLRARFPEADVPDFYSPTEAIKWLNVEVMGKLVPNKRFKSEFGRTMGELAQLKRAWDRMERIIKVAKQGLLLSSDRYNRIKLLFLDSIGYSTG